MIRVTEILRDTDFIRRETLPAWRGRFGEVVIKARPHSFLRMLLLWDERPPSTISFFGRQLAGAAAEMGRISVIEEAILNGYRDDWVSPWYPELMRRLLDADRRDLIERLSTEGVNVSLIHVQMERGDYRGALKTGEGVSAANPPPGEMIRDLARAYAVVNGVQAAIKWSARWGKTWAQTESLFGVADYLIRKQIQQGHNEDVYIIKEQGIV